MADAGAPRLRWLPAAVLALSLAATGLLCAWSVRNSTREASAELDRQASAFATALASRIQSYIDTLPGLRMFGVVQKSPSDAEFLHYVQAISLQNRFPGLALTFMADRVSDAQRLEYLRAVAADRSSSTDGHPGFEIRPPGERPVYMVLRHTFPLDLPAFGYDLYDPGQQYRAAVDAAVASGQYVATGPVLLARDRFAKNQPQLTSVVIRAAVYAHGAVPSTPEARLQAARGVVGISFRTNELVRSVLPPTLASSSHIIITDPQARSQAANDLLFDSAWVQAAHPPEAMRSDPWRTRIQVADRSWDVEVHSLGGAWTIDQSTGWLLALGLALSAALAAMTRILVQANRVADSRVRAATGALEAEKENLRRSEMRYRMLFAHSLDGVMRTLPGGAILAANAAACAMFGRSEAELQASARDELIDMSDPRVALMEAQRQATGSAKGVIRMRRADGSTFEADVATSSYVEPESGERMVASVIVRDITERQHLTEQHQRLAAILDATPDFVGSTDPEGGNIFLNLAARRMLGYGPRDDVSAVTIAECHPEWAGRLIVEQGLPMAIRDGFWTGRTAVAAADGREIPMLQVILCHRNERGEVTHISTIARDLTELERTESERRALEVSLREAQKMESIGTLAGGVAHDFNNVLAAILGNVAIARQDTDPGHPAQRSLALIHQAAVRARTLVQQIMTFSRRSPQALTVQALRPLVEEAVAMLRATLPASVRLETVLADEPLFARVDGAQVQQVVLNLCTNAWQALPAQQGRVCIRLDRINGAIPWARLQVEDDGSGMDEATRARIFEPFFTTKAVGQGTGLGLAVVHGIVSASGGSIEVHSRLGEGTRFDILLPLAPAEAAVAAGEETLPATAYGNGEQILYVDDDEVVALTMSALLQRAHYSVTCVHGAQQALDLVREQPRRFALVIADYNMPEMSGIALARALALAAPGLPVIISSGYVTEELKAQAQAAGVRAVLFKEYAFERLGAIVHAILQGGH
nr:CHASE domain-containing protein [uncultured Roseateles sp.]